PTGRFRSRPYGGLRRARVDSKTARPTARPDHRASHRDAEPLRLRFDGVPSRTDQPERELPVLEDDLVLGQVSVLPIPHGGAHAEIEDRIGCQFGRGHPELASALALFDQPSKPAFVPCPLADYAPPVRFLETPDLPGADERLQPMAEMEADVGLRRSAQAFGDAVAADDGGPVVRQQRLHGATHDRDEDLLLRADVLVQARSPDADGGTYVGHRGGAVATLREQPEGGPKDLLALRHRRHPTLRQSASDH